MDRRKIFTALLTIGVLLLITPFAIRLLFPGDSQVQSHTAEYFPVQDPLTGKWGFIDNQGSAITPMVFDWAGDFRRGLGLAESDGAMGYIAADFEATGEWAIAPRFELTHPGDQPAFGFVYGVALVRDKSGKWGYIDTAGKWAIKPRFMESKDYPGVPAGEFSDGLAWFQAVEMAERYQLDANEKIVRDENNKPLKVAYPRRLMGFIDLDGEIIIEPRFDVVQDFGEGLAAVRYKSKDLWGFIDRAGTRVIGPEFDSVGRFSEGLCAVSENGTWGYIDQEGGWVIEPKYQEARQFLNGLAPVRKGHQWGYINAVGEWIIEPTYDDADGNSAPGDARPFENGLARVTFNGKVIYINKSGEQVWPAE